MAEPRFVVTGSGRSGTGYIAAVLSAAGIPCGHEGWFNPQRDRADGLVGDSSWCAVPELAGYPGLVWHQVRHPLAVIASLAKAPLWGPYADLAAPYVRDAGFGPFGPETALWVALNEASERRATLRWRVEDVDVDLVFDLAGRLGLAVDPEAVKAAVEGVPRDVNDHGAGVDITWADLPDTPLTSRARRLSGRYGYR